MTDIRAIALIPIRPDAAQAAVPHLQELAAGTRGEEGNWSYELFESASTPGLFITVERWRSQSDLDAHMSTPHVAAAFEVLGSSLAGKVEVHPLRPASAD